MSSAATFVAELPFNKRVGVRPGAEGEVTLPDDPTLTNHVGTVHAGALFTLGEGASGVAVAEKLPSIFAGAMVVAKSASIEYRKPARGAVVARATVAEAPEAILERLARDGKTTFDVSVTLRAGDIEVATMTVHWYAKRQP